MKGFIEISASEQYAIIGGKDAEVARFLEMLGYGIGLLVKTIRDIKKKKQQGNNAAPALYMA